MRSTRDTLKDALWDDRLFVELAHQWGLDSLTDELVEFRRDLADQLAQTDRDDRWRRRTTALIIRVKARLRLLEGVRK